MEYSRLVSQKNVDFVLDAYARYNAGERTPTLWFFHENAEYHTIRAAPDTAVHRGLDAIIAQYERWEEAYPDLQVRPLEAKDAGHKVFLWVQFSGHGAGSGVPIDMEMAHVLTLEDGRVRRVQEYMDREAALDASGFGD